jgi:hypothetical protein
VFRSYDNYWKFTIIIMEIFFSRKTVWASYRAKNWFFFIFWFNANFFNSYQHILLFLLSYCYFLLRILAWTFRKSMKSLLLKLKKKLIYFCFNSNSSMQIMICKKSFIYIFEPREQFSTNPILSINGFCLFLVRWVWICF